MSAHSDVTPAVTLAPRQTSPTGTKTPSQQVASASQKVSHLTPYTHLSHTQTGFLEHSPRSLVPLSHLIMVQQQHNSSS